MPRYLVGVRPSGRLHLGHYASVIKPAIEHDADVLIAEYHAPEGSIDELNEIVSTLTRLRVKPDKIAFQRNRLNASLYFQMLQATPTGLLNHMPQYKEKEKNALMFTYPVLMAHDVAHYDYVVVGEDQRPHIEFAKDILSKMGIKYPEALYEGGKVMDLRHPDKKMSKSEPNSCLFLDDDDYKHKIMKAVTDEAGLKNLQNIYLMLGGVGGGYMRSFDNLDLKVAIIGLYERKFIKNV